MYQWFVDICYSAALSFSPEWDCCIIDYSRIFREITCGVDNSNPCLSTHLFRKITLHPYSNGNQLITHLSIPSLRVLSRRSTGVACGWCDTESAVTRIAGLPSISPGANQGDEEGRQMFFLDVRQAFCSEGNIQQKSHNNLYRR